MGDRGSALCLSLVSFKGMRSRVDKLFLWALFLSTTLQNAAVDDKKKKIKELPCPNLYSNMTVVRIGQKVPLTCFCKNTSGDITYLLFLGKRHLDSKKRRGKDVTFHPKISSASETGPYKCKANVSSVWKYSQEFNFTIAAKEESCPSCLPPPLLLGLFLGLLLIILVLGFLIQSKCRKRKALRGNMSKGSGEEQGALYANISETQTDAEQPQELHYATPVFREVASREQVSEGCEARKADYIYSELTH
ncbi:LOW QUALITY PROTEIN: allergin-1 [Psammomys obesus]|uniref:LOW QUALITY PROTEIN: allergin-1 n=1 Tax=Psammomys obesus TaxID=48139 RepID=UPI0024534FEF|nr:LOW QUALITY PROTEIN: allergin-1 [Psammomys obesus]